MNKNKYIQEYLEARKTNKLAQRIDAINEKYQGQHQMLVAMQMQEMAEAEDLARR
jgi:hypothetical protein